MNKLIVVGLFLASTASPSFASWTFEDALRFGISDNGFYKCISKHLAITRVEITTLESLACSGYNIESIEGIQQLEQLKYLDVSRNSITQVNPISALENLIYLDISNNKIQSIDPIYGNISLLELEASFNAIRDVSGIRNLRQINTLILSNNNFSSIEPINGLKDLVLLDISKNKLSDLDEFLKHSKFQMDGPNVFRLTARHFPGFIKNLFEKTRCATEDLATIIPHQASAAALEHLKRNLPDGHEKTIDIYRDFGNQIAASMPHALHKAREEGRLIEDSLSLLIGSSAGISIGGAVIRW